MEPGESGRWSQGDSRKEGRRHRQQHLFRKPALWSLRAGGGGTSAFHYQQRDREIRREWDSAQGLRRIAFHQRDPLVVDTLVLARLQDSHRFAFLVQQQPLHGVGRRTARPIPLLGDLHANMKKRMRRCAAERRSYWEEVVRRWEQGGQSVRGYCRAEGLRESAFYFWRRTLGRRQRTDAARELPLPASAATSTCC